jgi:hypothetical protein
MDGVADVPTICMTLAIYSKMFGALVYMGKLGPIELGQAQLFAPSRRNPK